VGHAKPGWEIGVTEWNPVRGYPAPVSHDRRYAESITRPSACNDEIVVYRITQMKAADSVTLDARKIVRGAEEEMGVRPCRFVPSSGGLTCIMARGVWHFSVRNDSLTGELRLRDSSRAAAEAHTPVPK
jgi:hypothetical protein